MNIIFCEECGSRNVIGDEALQNIDREAYPCQVCGFNISTEHLIDHTGAGKIVNTLTYKVLVIDDDQAHLNLLQTSLGKEYTVITAASGEEGIKAVAAKAPDLILLDIGMPDMDGYEICKRLKANSSSRHIPIIFVTAETRVDNELKGLALGAIDYIFKPFNLKILNAKLTAHLKFNAMRDELKREISKQQETIKALKQDILGTEGMGEKEDLKILGTSREEYRSLEQEKQNLISIVNTLNDIISIQDLNSKIIWANKAALAQFDVTYTDLQGKKCFSFYYNRDSPCPECFFADGATENTGEAKEVFIEKLGTIALQTNLPLYENGDKIAGIACTAQLRGGSDITVQTDARDNLDGSTDFIADSYKEFNDALSTLLVSSDAICNMYKDDKNLAKLNEYMADAINRLRAIFNALRKRM